MKFGKLENIDGVDFSLPPDHPINKTRTSANLVDIANFYIGCTAWTSKEWKGKYYPEKTKSTDFLIEYGKQFNTIELNTTHYRIPKLEQVQKWASQTPDDFKFCPKILQHISHSRDLGTSNNRINDFCNSIAGFEDKLGMCFIQLPPYFGADRLKVLEKFFQQFPSEIPLAVELRNESFYNSADNLNRIIELLKKYDRTFLITDVSGRRDILHMALSSNNTMIRFVGNNLHKTDYSRIDEWVSKLNSWQSVSLENAYFFPHEPDNINAPQISEYLCNQIKKNDNFNVRGPKLIAQQKSLF